LGYDTILDVMPDEFAEGVAIAVITHQFLLEDADI
jgi:hypothetical protein